MLFAAMNISTVSSTALTISENEIQLYKCQSDVLGCFFLMALLFIVLLTQPNQRKRTGHKPMGLVTGSSVLQAK